MYGYSKFNILEEAFKSILETDSFFTYNFVAGGFLITSDRATFLISCKFNNIQVIVHKDIIADITNRSFNSVDDMIVKPEEDQNIFERILIVIQNNRNREGFFLRKLDKVEFSMISFNKFNEIIYEQVFREDYFDNFQKYFNNNELHIFANGLLFIKKKHKPNLYNEYDEMCFIGDIEKSEKIMKKIFSEYKNDTLLLFPNDFKNSYPDFFI